jgi:hypothetical protein
LHASVWTDGYGEPQVAVKLAAGRGRVIQSAYSLDLLAPVLLVLREPVFRGARADEFFARSLLVLLDAPVDLRLKLHRGKRQVRQIAAG